ncbi:unnamed protein product, partial [Prorocentrum cordatum]
GPPSPSYRLLFSLPLFPFRPPPVLPRGRTGRGAKDQAGSREGASTPQAASARMSFSAESPEGSSGGWRSEGQGGCGGCGRRGGRRGGAAMAQCPQLADQQVPVFDPWADAASEGLRLRKAASAEDDGERSRCRRRANAGSNLSEAATDVGVDWAWASWVGTRLETSKASDVGVDWAWASWAGTQLEIANASDVGADHAWKSWGWTWHDAKNNCDAGVDSAWKSWGRSRHDAKKASDVGVNGAWRSWVGRRHGTERAGVPGAEKPAAEAFLRQALRAAAPVPAALATADVLVPSEAGSSGGALAFADSQGSACEEASSLARSVRSCLGCDWIDDRGYTFTVRFDSELTWTAVRDDGRSFLMWLDLEEEAVRLGGSNIPGEAGPVEQQSYEQYERMRKRAAALRVATRDIHDKVDYIHWLRPRTDGYGMVWRRKRADCEEEGENEEEEEEASCPNPAAALNDLSAASLNDLSRTVCVHEGLFAAAARLQAAENLLRVGAAGSAVAGADSAEAGSAKALEGGKKEEEEEEEGELVRTPGVPDPSISAAAMLQGADNHFRDLAASSAEAGPAGVASAKTHEEEEEEDKLLRTPGFPNPQLSAAGKLQGSDNPFRVVDAGSAVVEAAFSGKAHAEQEKEEEDDELIRTPGLPDAPVSGEARLQAADNPVRVVDAGGAEAGSAEAGSAKAHEEDDELPCMPGLPDPLFSAAARLQAAESASRIVDVLDQISKPTAFGTSGPWSLQAPVQAPGRKPLSGTASLFQPLITLNGEEQEEAAALRPQHIGTVSDAAQPETASGDPVYTFIFTV